MHHLNGIIVNQISQGPCSNASGNKSKKFACAHLSNRTFHGTPTRCLVPMWQHWPRRGPSGELQRQQRPPRSPRLLSVHTKIHVIEHCITTMWWLIQWDRTINGTPAYKMNAPKKTSFSFDLQNSCHQFVRHRIAFYLQFGNSFEWNANVPCILRFERARPCIDRAPSHPRN
jgi:hypothetical protein